MSYTLSEKKVLKKLGIKDFRHMTKDKLVQFASMLPKMDPEVAKAALSQFPSFSGLAKDLTEQLSIMVGREFDLSSDSQKAFFDACNRILTSLEKELEDDDIDSDERNRIEDKMIQVAQMLDKKDTDNKKRAEQTTTLSLRLPKHVHEELKALASDHGLSLTALIMQSSEFYKTFLILPPNVQESIRLMIELTKKYEEEGKW